MKTKVEPNEKRYPTTKWAGNYFSESMPAGGKEPVQSPTSPSAMPQGLSSINRVCICMGEQGGGGVKGGRGGGEGREGRR